MRTRAVLVAAVLPTLLAAQGDCFPSSESNEARTFGILSVPIAFSNAGGVGHDGLFVGLEGAGIPHVPRDLAVPTTCRPGKGPENTNPLALLGRLRVAYTLDEWQFEAGWIPPVRLSGVKANLVGLSAGRVIPFRAEWRFVPRAHVVLGSLHAPITCNATAIAQQGSECFEGELSNDRWTPGVFGVELQFARAGDGVRPYVGVGHNWLRPRFRVDFTNAEGERDRRRVEVDLTRLAMFAGITVPIGRFEVTGEGYGTVEDRLTARIVVRTGVGG